MGPYVLAFMFLIGGVIFALLGYSTLVSARKKRAAWIPVEGTVISLAEEPGDKGRTLYAPQYQYERDGKSYTATSTISSHPARYAVGDRIALLVDPARPDRSDVMDGSIGMFGYGMLAMGVLALAVGVFLLWLALTGQFRFE